MSGNCKYAQLATTHCPARLVTAPKILHTWAYAEFSFKWCRLAGWYKAILSSTGAEREDRFRRGVPSCCARGMEKASAFPRNFLNFLSEIGDVIYLVPVLMSTRNLMQNWHNTAIAVGTSSLLSHSWTLLYRSVRSDWVPHSEDVPCCYHSSFINHIQTLETHTHTLHNDMHR